MFLKYLITSLLILCGTCCPEDDCAAVLCAGPPGIALLVLEDGGNVFDNETYTLEDIVITGENSTEITLNLFDTENGEVVLFLDNFPWQLGENNYTLTFAGEASIDLQMNIVLSDGDGCCSGIQQLASFSSNDSVQGIEGGYFTVSVR